jgi:hypothetical protein
MKRRENDHGIPRNINCNNLAKGEQTKNLLMLFILIDNISRYLHFMHAEQLPGQITPERMVGTHPRSTAVPLVHH